MQKMGRPRGMRQQSRVLTPSALQAIVAALQAVSQKQQVAQQCVDELESDNQSLRAQNEELKSCNQTLRTQLEELTSGNQTLQTQLAFQKKGRPLTVPSAWLCSCLRRQPALAA